MSTPTAPVLIQLTESLVVHPASIRIAQRIGNYVHVYMHKDELAHQIWDEDGRLWKKLQEACR